MNNKKTQTLFSLSWWSKKNESEKEAFKFIKEQFDQLKNKNLKMPFTTVTL